MAAWSFGRRKKAAPQPKPDLARDLAAVSGAVRPQVRVAVSPPMPDPAALTAAAVPAEAPLAQFIRHPDRWQNELWGYFDTEGEFNYGVQWLANMCSRVRLRAAKVDPGSDEPVLQDDGIATEIVAALGQGVGGKSEIMKRLTVQLSVPGECYLIGETVSGVEHWQVRSIDEVRAASGGYQVNEENTVLTGVFHWRDLAPDSVPIRIWRPHDRWYHMADSPGRSALGILRELELVNRHITAQYLSRLASAGVLILPQEVSFPAREEFAEAEDPFMLEWIEIASEAIKKPGTASAVVPIPIRVPAEFVKDIQHLDFTLKIDEQIVAKRESVIKRLATKLDLPSDVLLGLADMNHWNAWAGQEQGIQAHIAPTVETICHALTVGYLQPRLAASGEDPAGWVVWYDMSELTLRPDRAKNALDAYDRLEINGDALRRETGFDPEDEPTAEELKEILLKTLVRTTHGAAPGAVDILVGTDLLNPASVGPGATDPSKGIAPEPGQGPQTPPDAAPAPTGSGDSATPPAQQAPATGPDSATAAATAAAQLAAQELRAAAVRAEQQEERRRVQARTQHAFRVLVDGRWDLRHPEVCRDHAYTCPFTHAVARGAPAATPGMPGTYVCSLDLFGALVVNGPAPYLDTGRMTSTPVAPGRAGANGKAVQRA